MKEWREIRLAKELRVLSCIALIHLDSLAMGGSEAHFIAPG
jgi:hypothetical protein